MNILSIHGNKNQEQILVEPKLEAVIMVEEDFIVLDEAVVNVAVVVVEMTTLIFTLRQEIVLIVGKRRLAQYH